ncbi:hypothetical protein JHS3_29670 [Jeongeupia sp. HS-3]|uniref:hypothetical protein n=1 Tax=Jeongeupia sp. HS-3 TaxID=1009682 RepID=UPI0018A52CFA|nr:hypothetical protein [Jeongeupia sp. HS-3]BCL77231.1 hypothetical protein JHS3_29670 [Jeongeupia sp. HS-3]
MLSRLKTLLSTQLSGLASRSRRTSMAMATTIPQIVAHKISRAAYHDLLFRIEMAQLSGQALSIRAPADAQPPLLRSIIIDIDKLAVHHPDQAKALRLRLYGCHDVHAASARARFVSAAQKAPVRIHSRN